MAGSSKHVVLIPLPAQGHLLPIFYLARKLVGEYKCAVTIINVDSIHDSVKQTWTSVPQQDIRLESIPMELKLPKGFSGKTANLLSLFADSIQSLEDPLVEFLAKLTAAQPVSCVISDFYHTAAPKAASRVGIPSVCFWSGTASWACIQYHLPLLIAAGSVPVQESNADEMVHLPGLKPMRAIYLPIYLHKDDYDKLEEPRHLRQSERANKDTWILANSFYDFEPEAFDAMQQLLPGKFVAVGPLFPLGDGGEASLRPEDRSCLRWLDNHPPRSVLYVAFGSITILTRDEFEDLIEGLQASGHPFLLVVPPEMIPEVAGERLDELAKEAARSGDGMIVKWSPQLAVLRHGSVGGFLTHCGWNSIFESMICGVPMLGWPRASEQNTNCKLLLEERGVGIELKNRSSSGIAQAVRELMLNEELRSRVEEAGKKARAAVAPGGSSQQNLRNFFEYCC